MSVTVTVPKELRAELGRLEDARRAVTEGAAMGIEAALRDHFMALQRQPRRDGLRPTGFWYGSDGNSVAEQIGGHVVHSDGAASVAIDSPELKHKLTGGTVRASDYGHTYLTIPANDEAAQAPQGARSFSADIEWVEDEDGVVRPALVSSSNYVKISRNAKTGGVRRKYQADASKANAGVGDVLFWLVRQVTHAPMPGALPPEQDLADAALASALDALDALTSMKGTAA